MFIKGLVLNLVKVDVVVKDVIGQYIFFLFVLFVFFFLKKCFGLYLFYFDIIYSFL